MNRLPILVKMFVLLVCISMAAVASNTGSTVGEVLRIPEVEFAPTVDGELDADWTAPEVCNFVYTDDIFPATNGELISDHSCLWKAAWNEDGFYFFGQVFDDIIYAEGANSYEQDCFEIYFDGGNEKATAYDGNDVQWRYVYGLTADSSGWCDLGTSGECAWVETDTGWDFELALPAEVLVKDEVALFALAEGTTIGWEVQAADNDTNYRDVMTKWWSNSNNSWQDPSLFGTAELAQTSAVGIEEEAVSAGIALSAPAVISAGATVSYDIAARSSVSLSLVNIAGQVVKVLDGGVKSAGTHTAALDADGLANGVYFVNLNACGSSASDKVLLIK